MGSSLALSSALRKFGFDRGFPLSARMADSVLFAATLTEPWCWKPTGNVRKSMDEVMQDMDIDIGRGPKLRRVQRKNAAMNFVTVG